MVLRKIQEKDIEQIRNLYAKIEGFRMPARPNLPGNGLDGFVATTDDDSKIIGATYVFMAMNAPYCWIEWSISDKDYRGKDRKLILPQLIDYACSQMKEAGYQVAFAFASEPQKLIEKYEAAGFKHDGHWCRELIRWL